MPTVTVVDRVVQEQGPRFQGLAETRGSLWQSGDAERLYDWNHCEGKYPAIRLAAFFTDGRFVATTAGNESIILECGTRRIGEAMDRRRPDPFSSNVERRTRAPGT